MLFIKNKLEIILWLLHKIELWIGSAVNMEQKDIYWKKSHWKLDQIIEIKFLLIQDFMGTKEIEVSQDINFIWPHKIQEKNEITKYQLFFSNVQVDFINNLWFRSLIKSMFGYLKHNFQIIGGIFRGFSYWQKVLFCICIAIYNIDRKRKIEKVDLR